MAEDRTRRNDGIRRKLEETEDELRRLRAKYKRLERTLHSIQSILPEFPVVFVVISGDKSIIYANNRFEAAFKTRNTVGRSYDEVIYPPGAVVNGPIERALQTATQEQGSVTLADGLARRCVAKPIQLGDGNRALLAVFYDAGARQTPPGEAELQTEKLSALGELISGIAHEINNPLTGVIGFSELLSQRGLEGKDGEMIRRILTEANRCKRIVANLLSFSRKHAVKRDRVDVGDLVQQTAELLAYEFRLHDIRLEYHISPGLPPITGDPSLLQQVFFNIIRNALQAMSAQEGGGLLRIAVDVCDAFVRVTFGDTGPGISEDLRGRIFDPFFTTKSAEKGTGLGLSISHRIIEQHGGQMSVASEPGNGATFTVTLPVSQAPMVAADVGAGRRVVTEFRRGNILIVDDEQHILDLLKEVLSSKQHVVTTTRHASEALRVMETSSYDCVISDIKMPELDGKDFLAMVKAAHPDMTNRLIFITGDYLSDQTANYVRDSGIPCLVKPFSPSEILELTHEVLAKNGPSGSNHIAP